MIKCIDIPMIFLYYILGEKPKEGNANQNRATKVNKKSANANTNCANLSLCDVALSDVAVSDVAVSDDAVAASLCSLINADSDATMVDVKERAKVAKNDVKKNVDDDDVKEVFDSREARNVSLVSLSSKVSSKISRVPKKLKTEKFTTKGKQQQQPLKVNNNYDDNINNNNNHCR